MQLSYVAIYVSTSSSQYILMYIATYIHILLMLLILIK